MTVIYEDIHDADCDVLVVAVNAEGVMGKGQALMFKHRFPKAAEAYRQACLNPKSSIHTHGYLIQPLDSGRNVLFFVTKKTWRENSSKAQLKSVFKAIAENEPYTLAGLLVASPPLGAGLGRLKRQEVLPYIKKSFITLGAFVDIYDLPINKPRNKENE